MPQLTKRVCIDCGKPLPRHNRITKRCRKCQGNHIAPIRDPTTYIKKVEKRIAEAEQNKLPEEWKIDKLIITPKKVQQWLSEE